MIILQFLNLDCPCFLPTSSPLGSWHHAQNARCTHLPVPLGAANATNLRTAIRAHGWHLPFSLKGLGYFTQGWQTWLRIQPCLDQDGFKEALDLLDNPERFAIHGVPSGQDLKCYSSDSASAMKRAPVFRSQRHAHAFFES